MASAWEQRFPTFSGGSPSPTVHATPMSSLSSKHRPNSPADAQAAAPHLRPTVVEPKSLASLREVTRRSPSGTPAAAAPATGTTPPRSRPAPLLSPPHLRQRDTPPANFQTPHEALRRAAAGHTVTLNFSSSSIRPGTTPATTGSTPLPGIGREPPARQQPDASEPTAEVFGKTRFGKDPKVEKSPPGFNRFEDAVEVVHRRLTSVPLEERWEMMAECLQNVFHDQESKKYEHVAKTMFFNLAQYTKSKAPANPSGVQTAVTMMLLEQALHLLARSRPALRQVVSYLRDDILSAIYVDEAISTEEKPKEKSGGLHRGSIGRAEKPLDGTFRVIENPTDVEAQTEQIERFHKKTYFQLCRELSTKCLGSPFIAETKERSRRQNLQVLERAIQRAQSDSVRRTFMAWHSWTKHQRAMMVGMKENDELLARITNLEQELERRNREIQAESHAHQQEVNMLKQQIQDLSTRSDHQTMVDEAALREVERLNKQLQRENNLLRKTAEVFSTAIPASRPLVLATWEEGGHGAGAPARSPSTSEAPKPMPSDGTTTPITHAVHANPMALHSALVGYFLPKAKEFAQQQVQDPSAAVVMPPWESDAMVAGSAYHLSILYCSLFRVPINPTGDPTELGGASSAGDTQALSVFSPKQRQMLRVLWSRLEEPVIGEDGEEGAAGVTMSSLPLGTIFFPEGFHNFDSVELRDETIRRRHTCFLIYLYQHQHALFPHLFPAPTSKTLLPSISAGTLAADAAQNAAVMSELTLMLVQEAVAAPRHATPIRTTTDSTRRPSNPHGF